MITKSNKYLNLVSELFPFTINISNFGCGFVKLQLPGVTNLFWFQVFEGFIKLTEKIEITSQTVAFMHLWYNQTFKIGDNSLLFKNYLDRGIHFVGDFIDQTGNLYPFYIFMQKWNVRTNFVQYNSIHSSIKRVCDKVIQF